jgi:hypothetical protein
MPQVAIYIGAALVAVAVLSSALVLTGTLPIIGGGQVDPVVRPIGGASVDPVWRAAEDWERQRRQQSAFVDPVLRSADDWEIQRRQQSPYIDWAARSAAQWEEQRRQQNGF